MSKALILGAFLAFSLALNAQPPSAHADANPAAEAEIKALESTLAGLVVKGEWDEFAKHLASDYSHIRDNGHVEGKDEAMGSLRDVNRKIIVMEMEPDVEVRIYGDTAVSSAQFTISVRESGQVKTRRTRQTDVFVKRDSQWWLVAGHNTTIGK
jgi:ketosteroid isomerase-like protein